MPAAYGPAAPLSRRRRLGECLLSPRSPPAGAQAEERQLDHPVDDVGGDQGDRYCDERHPQHAAPRVIRRVVLADLLHDRHVDEIDRVRPGAEVVHHPVVEPGPCAPARPLERDRACHQQAACDRAEQHPRDHTVPGELRDDAQHHQCRDDAARGHERTAPRAQPSARPEDLGGSQRDPGCEREQRLRGADEGPEDPVSCDPRDEAGADDHTQQPHDGKQSCAVRRQPAERATEHDGAHREQEVEEHLGAEGPRLPHQLREWPPVIRLQEAEHRDDLPRARPGVAEADQHHEGYDPERRHDPQQAVPQVADEIRQRLIAMERHDEGACQEIPRQGEEHIHAQSQGYERSGQEAEGPAGRIQDNARHREVEGENRQRREGAQWIPCDEARRRARHDASICARRQRERGAELT
jgi:hypothetical protein